jgi:hypothetical protein
MEITAESSKHLRKIDNDETFEDKSKRSEDKTTSNNDHDVDNTSDGNGYGQNLDSHDVGIRRNTAGSETTDPHVNSHHIVGGSWELIHHHPTAYLSSLSSVNTTLSNNTTMHSEYSPDDVIDGVAQYDADDVTQYEKVEKLCRKPRVSRVRPIRSVETDYEVRELSEIDKPMPQNSNEENGHVVMINTKAIKRDGKFDLRMQMWLAHCPWRGLASCRRSR